MTPAETAWGDKYGPQQGNTRNYLWWLRGYAAGRRDAIGEALAKEPEIPETAPHRAAQVIGCLRWRERIEAMREGTK